MKKFFATFICVVAFATNMSAQFSEGTKFLGASLTGADLSYSKNQNLGLGAEAKAGYFIMDDLMLQAEAGFDVRFKECQKIFVGGKGRYYVADKVYVGAGVKLLHEFKNYNDFMISPEVGYSFLVNSTLAIEPAFFVDISTTSFSKYTKVGVKIGIGIFAD
ncbi:MAG: hypothetical protein IJ163_03530 [Bacteroidaceae bacterium]|jgi:hypothetical protein|nr:hypothetical protein [Bacteroidaceae bacterium]